MDLKKIGKLIRKIRKDNNLTQEEFAKKYGVTYQAVSKWENGINLPDISLLKQISKDYNVSFEDILEGEMIRNGNKKQITFFVCLAILVIIVGIILAFYFSDNKKYNFKTFSSNCSEFKVSGSIAYDKNNSSIYINKINYCSGDDQTVYDLIECSLYEKVDNSSHMISKCKSNGTYVKLEEYLDQATINVDNYKQVCKTYNNNSLYLEISAYKDNKITTYKVPLNFNDNCTKE